MIKDIKTGNENSYEDILQKSNSENIYYPVYRYDSAVDFIINLIKALVSNNDITLIDADFSDSEIANYNLISVLNKEQIRIPSTFNSVKEMLEYIPYSKSKITIFTSGTTGVPRKVNHTVQSLTRLTRMGDKYNDNVWALAYNPTHMAGLQVIFQAILNQNKLINVFGSPLEKIVSAIQIDRITHISATPTFYRLLVSSNTIFENIHRITLGGEKSDSTLHNSIQKKFPNARINNVYATTEFGSLLVAKDDVFCIPEHLTSKVKIENNELYVVASLLATEKTEGWYKTGDEVEVLSSNPLTFRFIGRKSEMINVGGNKVNPAEVEDLIRKFDEVKDVLVFGKPNSVLGNILHVNIVLHEGKELDKKSILNRLREELQEFKVPRLVNFVEAISTTRTGKISRL